MKKLVGANPKGTFLKSGLGTIAVAALIFSALAGCEIKPERPSAQVITPSRADGISGANLSSFENRWAAVAISGETALLQRGTTAWQPLSLGEILEPDTKLMSGSAGVILLERGADLMVVAENTEIEIPATPAQKGLTRIINSIGTLLLRVDKKPDRKFKVKTPYLVATVKGTEFDVTVEGEGASVSVTEGVVGVSRADGGNEVNVVPGQTASVSSATPPGAAPAITPTPTPGAKSAKPSLPPKGKPSSAPNASSNKGKGGNSGNSNAGGNSDNGNSDNSNAGGNSDNSNAGGNSDNSNAGGKGKGKGKK